MAPGKSHSKRRLVESTADPLADALKKTLSQIKLKDEYMFFEVPVNVEEVTDYLTVVSKPMDFGTMQTKIINGEYATLEEFESDVDLICDNAKKYNNPATLYYKQADKVQKDAKKIIAKDRPRLLKLWSTGFAPSSMAGSSAVGTPTAGEDDDDIDVHTYDDDASQPLSNSLQTPSTHTYKPRVPQPKVFYPEASSSGVPRKRALYRKTVEGTYVFSSSKRFRSMHSDGSLIASGFREMTVMPVQSIPQKNVPNMGQLFGSFGPEAERDEANKAITSAGNYKVPVSYVDYGPYAVFGPQIDGRDASCNADESDLLALTYADLEGTSYAMSMEAFAKNAGPAAVSYAHRIIDTLTGGMHSVAKASEAEVVKVKAAGDSLTHVQLPESASNPFYVMSTETNPDAYDIFNDFKEAQQQGITLPKLDAPITMAHVKKVLDDAGVASDFIPDRLLAQQLTVQKDFSTQGMLDQNAKFLWYLVQLQKERLARSRSEPVSSLEKQLANILRERLVLIIKASPPSLVASKRAIELALPKMQSFEAVFLGTMIRPATVAVASGPSPASLAAIKSTASTSAASMPAAASIPKASPAVSTLAAASARPNVAAIPAGHPVASYRVAGNPVLSSGSLAATGLVRPPVVGSRPPNECNNCHTKEGAMTLLKTKHGNEALCPACLLYYNKYNEHRPDPAWLTMAAAASAAAAAAPPPSANKQSVLLKELNQGFVNGTAASSSDAVDVDRKLLDFDAVADSTATPTPSSSSAATPAPVVVPAPLDSDVMDI